MYSILLRLGRTWFRSLREHHKDLKIPNQEKAVEVRQMTISEKEWMSDRDHFIRTHAGDFVSGRHIFRIEVDEIQNPKFPTIKIDFAGK